jgi:hypothetical protein
MCVYLRTERGREEEEDEDEEGAEIATQLI